MAKPKQLLGLAALELGNKLLDDGVPMSRVHLRLDPDWHYLSTYAIFMADRKKKYAVTRPAWLQDEPVLQRPPEDWAFEGNFPNGKWVKK